MQLSKNQISTSIPIMIIGATATLMQILIIQKLISQFFGNELCIGIALSFWLIWTAAGSFLVPKIVKMPVRTGRGLALISMIWTFLAFLTLFIIQSMKTILGVSAGELFGFIPMVIIIFIVLGPFCITSGYLFIMACHWKGHKGTFTETLQVYFFEAIGSFTGGLAASLFLLQTYNSVQIVLLVLLINCISIGFILGGPVFRRLLQISPVLAGCAIMWTFSPNLQHRLDTLSFPGQSVVLSKNTAYGQITITRLQNQWNIFQDGLWAYTSPDAWSAESAVHYTLLQHPEPVNVLMIGGGGSDLLTEILKHPSVQCVDYVEMNPSMTHLIRQTIPDAEKTFKRSEIHLHYKDPRRFLIESEKRYDVILSSLPNPYTNQLNRFYTTEFFRLIKNHLTDQGVFGFQIGAAENTIGPELADCLSMMTATVKNNFTDLTVLPGQVQYWMASKVPGSTFSDAALFQKRLSERKISVQFIRDYYIRYNFSRDRIEQIQDQIQNAGIINTDFKPMGYYYNTVLWATQFSRGFKILLTTMNRFRLGHWALFLLSLFMVELILLRHKSNSFFNTLHVVKSIWAVGFTEISLEFIFILGLQILWGVTYQVIAVLVSAFMAGLSAGSYFSLKKTGRTAGSFSRFRTIQIIMTVYPLICLVLMILCQRIQATPFRYAIPVIFILLAFFAGAAGGFQFILGSRLTITSKQNMAVQAGFVYGFDLFGSSVGALLSASILIPLLGILNCLLLLSLMNGLVWILMILRHDQRLVFKG